MFIDTFGSNVFNDDVRKKYLKPETYKKLENIRNEGAPMDQQIADEIADAMMKWAVEKGATHYTHWFQPMTGITAEKHESFMEPGPDGKPVLKFSSKALIKGEADASSFPSGGMRATFEGRGYTVWDPTSDAFIKDKTLCIPTAFCSYTGAVLDKKTPLLRSMAAISRQSLRVIRALGGEAKYVYPTVGCEQEYFLINKADYAKRTDLILTGHTLFGAATPKGQMLETHYYGSIRPRVKAFMEELNEELWQLGIYSKTEHNEVAPCQHEMAPLFGKANVATDQNQLVMEVMKKIADKHDFVCLLHEKPFGGINGSGKHNNWSLSTDKGENIFKPGKVPAENTRFLLFLAAVIRSVDDYQDLLRISCSTASNDLRLGGNEAPPAIISVFLGDDLLEVVGDIIAGETTSGQKKNRMQTLAESMPALKKDTTDRNRTSPFAFTGNRFEFRMPGSSVNVSCANYILNAVVADALSDYADELERGGREEAEKTARAIIRRELIAHRRIIFNGNGYGKEWIEEAEKRGLLNIASTPEAYSHFDDEKNIALFERQNILNADEIASRKAIGLTEYVKTVNIEAKTMLMMIEKQIIPAVTGYVTKLSEGVCADDSRADLPKSMRSAGKKLAGEVGEALRDLYEAKEELESLLAKEPADMQDAGNYLHTKVRPQMDTCRKAADLLETHVRKEDWPFPDYTDILFYM